MRPRNQPESSRRVLAPSLLRLRPVPKNLIVAAALTSVIILIGFVHAPVIPTLTGAALACVLTVWRGRSAA
jgi:hypothetical protein